MKQLLTSIFNQIKKFTRGAKGTRPQRHQSFRPRLEGLERRDTPSTFTVTTTATYFYGVPAVGGLPWAVAQANADHTGGNVAINVSPALNGQTISLPGNLLLNNSAPGESITLNAPAGGYIFLAGGGAASNYSVLEVNTGTQATLNGVYVINGHTSWTGGGISNYGTLTMNQGGVEHCAADYGGGAISNYGYLTLNGTYLSGDTAGIIGGGIYNNGTLVTNSSCEVASCSAPQGSGGGIYNSGSGTAYLYGSWFILDSAHSGGGVDNEGAMYSGFGSPSYFYSNSATSAGGGVYNNGTLYATGVTFSNNTAQQGGGLYNRNYAYLAGGCTISNNTASGNGGGVSNVGTLTIYTSTISGNWAGGYGGGVYGASGTIVLSNDTITGNTAYYAGGVYANASGLSLYANNISGNHAAYYFFPQDVATF